ncbi:hypothetical protein QBC44DRAFT_140947 [Cladorrhinum sp. PSN332]|nr:hypothetical protein QBC44DRAFT_140947 [Cladorrhinum sp. PSN332]
MLLNWSSRFIRHFRLVVIPPSQNDTSLRHQHGVLCAELKAQIRGLLKFGDINRNRVRPLFDSAKIHLNPLCSRNPPVECFKCRCVKWESGPCRFLTGCIERKGGSPFSSHCRGSRAGVCAGGLQHLLSAVPSNETRDPPRWACWACWASATSLLGSMPPFFALVNESRFFFFFKLSHPFVCCSCFELDASATRYSKPSSGLNLQLLFCNPTIP